MFPRNPAALIRNRLTLPGFHGLTARGGDANGEQASCKHQRVLVASPSVWIIEPISPGAGWKQDRPESLDPVVIW